MRVYHLIAIPLKQSSRGRLRYRARRMLGTSLFLVVLSVALPVMGQDRAPLWQAQVRKYCEAQKWDSALRVVDQELSRAPQDMDVRAWRARILAWSGRLSEAEKEYQEILATSGTDPDNWMGLGSVYAREGRIPEALEALNQAVARDPARADLRVALARVLRAAGQRSEARREFQKALSLNFQSVEARAGLLSLRAEPKHELRFGQDTDLFNFASANHAESANLTSQWTSHWTTSASGNFYQIFGLDAEKFVGSVTGREPKWGALTVGGAIGHDNAAIPKSEAFFNLDHGWKSPEAAFFSGLEFNYGQHWYWYRSSRILALSGTTIVYLAKDCTLAFGATGARSAFSGAGEEWRPSGITRLGFPLVNWRVKRLSANIFYAVGTENFAQIDQIGSLASQTYGGGLRFQITALQEVTGYGSYQKRTQDRSDTAFGLSYGIHF